MAVTYKGTTDFTDQHTPAPGKSEYGMDTLTRRMKGAATKLADYVAGLAQGQTYTFKSNTFYLQTWTVDESPVYPSVTLNYKGLVGAIPDAVFEMDTCLRTMSVGKSANFKYDAKTGGFSSSGATSPFTRDIQYFAPEVRFRYITSSQPTGGTKSLSGLPTEFVIVSSAITDGTSGIRVAGSVPTGLLTALTPTIVDQLLSLRASPVIGSSYWEVDESRAATFLVT